MGFAIAVAFESAMLGRSALQTSQVRQQIKL